MDKPQCPECLCLLLSNGWCANGCNARLYSIGDRLITPHGVGIVVDIESHDKAFNAVSYDSSNAISWRYGIKHDVQPKGFTYSPLYYYPRELKKENSNE